MADEDEIVVNIESDSTATTTDGNTPDPVEELKSQYAELQRKDAERETRLASERTAREAAERTAAAARKDAETARTEVADSQLDTVTQGIAAATAEADAAEREYNVAFEAGDGKAMASAQRKMAQAVSKLGRLDEAKADLETRRPEKSGRVEAPQRTEAPSDPVEAYIQGRTEPTANWLRSHKDWVTDPKKNARLTSAHWAAVADGLTADTDEYFAHIETAIGLKQAAGANGHAPGANGKTPARRGSAPVAPVIASGGGTSGGSKEVRLTKGEATAATDGSITWGKHDLAAGRIRDANLVGKAIGHTEFARRKLAMQQQGLYDKTYVEQ